MSRRWPAGLVALFTVLALASTGQCKPPDLPLDQDSLPNATEIVLEPSVLEAIGVLNSYPIQILKIEEFDTSGPCGEEICEDPEPEVIQRMPKEEPETESESKPEKPKSTSAGPRCLGAGQITSSAKSCARPGLVENVKRLKDAKEAMKKAHQLHHAGDYAGAAKCLEQAQEALAGTAWAGLLNESLKCAREHCSNLEAMKKRDELRKAAQQLRDRNVNQAEAAPACQASGACGAAKPACGIKIVTGQAMLGERHGFENGVRCIGRTVQATNTNNGVSVEVTITVTATNPPKVVRRSYVSQPACGKGMPCVPPSCCAMGAYLHQVPLMLALEHVRAATGCKVVIDAEGLHKAGVSPIVPVTLDVQGMPLYGALDLMLRPHGLQATLEGDTIHVTCSPECRKAVSGCGVTKAMQQAANKTACEDACPKCATMHAKAVQVREAAAKKILVEGLMKACRLAVVDGRYAKAADLARQAHAVDPARVESDPMVIKLDLLGGAGAPKVRVLTGTSTPAGAAGVAEEAEEMPDGQTKLVPHLPGTFPDVVGALEALAGQVELPADR